MHTTPNGASPSSPSDPATDRDGALAHAARLCWHAAQICRVLRHALDELHQALTEVGEHTDAIIELAVDVGLAIDVLTTPAELQREAGAP